MSDLERPKTQVGPTSSNLEGIPLESTVERDVTETPTKEIDGVLVDEYTPDIPEDDYEYPDGGYGWVVLGCCMTLAATTMGFGLTWGVFQAHYRLVVFPDDGSSVLSLIGSVNGLLLNGTSFISGRVADRFGFKKCLLVSSFLAWIALFLAAWSTKVWQVMLTQGVMSGFAFGIGVPVFFSLPSQWFKKRRGLASGLAVGGAGFGASVALSVRPSLINTLGGCLSAIMARQMLADLGIRYTLIIFSFINLACMLTATALIRTQPDSPEARAKGRGPWLDKRVLRVHAFKWIAVSFFMNPLGYITVVYYLQSYVETVLKPSSAVLTALPLSINSLSGGFGRAMCGFAADRFGALNTLVMVCFLSGLFVLSVWMTADSYGAVMAFGILYGFIAPTYVSIVPLVARAIFGPTNLASNVGICLLITSPGNLAGAPLGGLIQQATGEWKWLIAYAGIIQVFAGSMALVGRLWVNKKPWAKL